ncbi:MAG: hypothetical protein CFE45_08150, partial [Burkholderiales bacterium PBB5]
MNFAGADGAGLAALSQRLTGAETALAPRLQLQAGVEIRSTGSLTLRDDWNLLSFNDLGQVVARAGGQPIRLTLRAADHLNLSASLSDGFRNAVTVVGTPDANASALLRAQASAVRTNSFIQLGQGASLRLVGGADLGAADVMATQFNGTGDVLIGRTTGTSTTVLVRTTTGSIDIAAARDVRLLNRQASVYTTGTPVDTTGLAGYQRPAASLLISAGSDRQGPFLAGGGAVSLTAGRDLVGSQTNASQYATDWWWRQAGNSASSSSTWWSRYDLFLQGVATFGGGDIRAMAGRDAVSLALSAPTSGALLGETSPGGERTVLSFGGGSVTLTAGRDVVDGFVLAGGARADIEAGRALVATGGPNGLQLLHQNTAVSVQARNGLTLGQLASAGLVAPLSRQGAQSTNGLLIGGMSPDATAAVRSSSGDVNFTGQQPDSVVGPYAQRGAAEHVVPSTLAMAAPHGSITVQGDLFQVPVAGASLSLLAGQDLRVSAVSVTGSQPAMGQPFATDNTAMAERLDPFPRNNTRLESGARDPVRLVAAQGSLSFDAVQVASPVRMVAGQDIAGRVLTVQHQAADELSVVQAGRDVHLTASTADAGYSFKVHGPGDLLVVAGRDIGLGTSGGIGSVGNLENAALPTGGAQLTLLAGGRPDAAVLATALGRYLPTANPPTAAPTSADGPTAADTQAYLARLLAFVQSRGGPLVVGAAQARQAFANLPLEARWLFMQSVLFDELRASGRLAAASAGAEREAAYGRGFAALPALYPGTQPAGDIRMTSRPI